MKEAITAEAELRSIRTAIDGIDQRIVELLAARLREVARAFEVKRSRGESLIDPAREAEILRTRGVWGREHGLTREVTDRLFRLLLEISHDKAVAESGTQ